MASHLHSHDTAKDLETAPSKIILKSFGPVNRPLVPAASASSLYSGPKAAASIPVVSAVLPGYGDEATAQVSAKMNILLFFCFGFAKGSAGIKFT